jgi:pimeloyl-ACP methyl ester carboxylesterase
MQLDDGGRLYYEARGRGRPIVFVHGWSGSHVLWNHQVEELQHGFHTVVYDQRGHGRSCQASGPYTMETYSGDLAQLLRGLDLDDVVLVGWSMGFIVALDYFARYGAERVSQLVLLSGSPRLTRSADWSHGFELSDLHGLGEAMSIDRARTTRMFLGALFGSARGEELVDLVTRLALDVPMDIAVQSFASEIEADLRHVVPAIDVPTLVVHGDQDHPTCIGAADYMMKQLRRGERIVLSRCGHYGPLEAASSFNQTLTRFINEGRCK